MVSARGQKGRGSKGRGIDSKGIEDNHRQETEKRAGGTVECIESWIRKED